MKPLSQHEIQSLLDEIQLLLGSQLQEVVTTPSGLYLGHYLQPLGQRGQTRWLQVDAHQNLPFFSVTQNPPPARAKTRAPLHLFLVAHAKGRRLSSARLLPELGRVVELYWGPLDAPLEVAPCRLEFRMIPSKVNLIATCQGLSISWRKVGETKKIDELGVYPASGPGRAPDVLRSQWEKRGARSDEAAHSIGTTSERATLLRERLSQEIEKKQGALQKMSDQLRERDPAHLNQVADWIRDHWSLDIPEAMKLVVPELFSLIQSDIPKTLATIHARLKKLKSHHEQGTARLQGVQTEIADLKSILLKSDDDLLAFKGGKPKGSVPEKRLPKVSGKRLDLSDSQFVVVGRSAAENLQILRDAQPWDLWLHLKDLPSAHGIIRRLRGQSVSDADLALAIHFVLKMTPKVARHLRAGDRIEGIVAERRFVSPLKGDHLGRVTVQQSRIILMKYDPQKLTRS